MKKTHDSRISVLGASDQQSARIGVPVSLSMWVCLSECTSSRYLFRNFDRVLETGIEAIDNDMLIHPDFVKEIHEVYMKMYEITNQEQRNTIRRSTEGFANSIKAFKALDWYRMSGISCLNTGVCKTTLVLGIGSLDYSGQAYKIPLD